MRCPECQRERRRRVSGLAQTSVLPSLSRSDAEDETKCLVHGAQFAGVEAPNRPAESLRVDNGRLFDNDPCLAPVDCDRGPERRRASAGRGGRYERRREAQELVGLHYHCIAGPTLLVPTGTSRGRQVKHLATNHVSPPILAQGRPSARGYFASPHGRLHQPPDRSLPPEGQSGLAGALRPPSVRCVRPPSRSGRRRERHRERLRRRHQGERAVIEPYRSKRSTNHATRPLRSDTDLAHRR